jgi:hypothetical protein
MPVAVVEVVILLEVDPVVRVEQVVVPMAQ